MLTVKQAAARLNLSASKTYQLIERRELSYFRVGGKILIAEEDLHAFLAARRVEAEGQRPASPRPRKLTLRHLSLD